MATIEEALIYGLGHNGGVSALVSTRVYGPKIPQNATMPCICVTRIDTPRILTHDTSGAAGTAHPRFQIDAWATTHSSAKTITDAVRGYLNGFHGTIGGGGYTATVQGALVDNERIEYDTEGELYRSQSDYIIWHTE